jgi:hypothetical protein
MCRPKEGLLGHGDQNLSQLCDILPFAASQSNLVNILNKIQYKSDTMHVSYSQISAALAAAQLATSLQPQS